MAKNNPQPHISSTSRNQLNVRLSDDEVQRIDQRRIQLQAELGRIPTRSEILRLALDRFLAIEKVVRKK